MNRFGRQLFIALTFYWFCLAELEGARFQGYPEPSSDPAPAEPAVTPPPHQENVGREEESWGGTIFGEQWHVYGPRGGISAEYVYTGEVFNNARGGISTRGATKYRGNMDMVFSCDMDTIAGIEGGTFFLYGQTNHGESLTRDYVGDYQILSNLDPCPYNQFTQVSEYWWLQEFGDGNLWTKIGKQDSNADFCCLDLSGDFIGSSFGVIPTVPLPTFPDPGMGISVFYTWDDAITFKAGVYDGAPRGGTWGFHELGEYGVFSIFELQLLPRFGVNEELTGVYRFGLWNHSGDFELVDGSGDTHNGNYGFYMAFDQLVYREGDDPEGDQGLGLFFQFGWAPEEYNEINRYYGCGLNYKGLLPGRDDDYIALGYARAQWGEYLHVNDGYTQESVIEFYYLMQLTDAILVQPDVQYIANPGGLDGRDALAVGLRFEIAL